MMKYLVVFISFLLLLCVYVLLLLVEKRKIKKFFDREKEKIRIVNDLITIDKKIKKKEAKLKEYPNICTYLSQAGHILKNNGFIIDDIEISTLRELPENAIDNFSKTCFLEECIKAPKTVFELINECSSVLGCIYKLNHPVKYAVNEFKKNMIWQILKLSVELIKKTKRRPITKGKIESKTKGQAMEYGFINEPICA